MKNRVLIEYHRNENRVYQSRFVEYDPWLSKAKRPRQPRADNVATLLTKIQSIKNLPDMTKYMLQT